MYSSSKIEVSPRISSNFERFNVVNPLARMQVTLYTNDMDLFLKKTFLKECVNLYLDISFKIEKKYIPFIFLYGISDPVSSLLAIVISFLFLQVLALFFSLIDFIVSFYYQSSDSFFSVIDHNINSLPLFFILFICISFSLYILQIKYIYKDLLQNIRLPQDIFIKVLFKSQAIYPLVTILYFLLYYFFLIKINSGFFAVMISPFVFSIILFTGGLTARFFLYIFNFFMQRESFVGIQKEVILKNSFQVWGRFYVPVMKISLVIIIIYVVYLL
jgi:hypothetical protein